MAKLQLFEYCVYLDDQEDDGEIIIAPSMVLARTVEQARVKASNEIPAKHMDDLSKIVVLVRPFGGG